MPQTKWPILVVIALVAVAAVLPPNAVIAGSHWISKLVISFLSTQLFGMVALLLIGAVVIAALRNSLR